MLQCPRCGLQNQPGITACARCGLPVDILPGGRAPQPPSTPQRPPAAPVGGPPPGYGPSPAYGLPPGRGQPSGYGGPGTSPFGPSALLQDRGTLATVGVLGLGALLSLVYALWAFTARRGIFADFSNGISVTNQHATSSDRLDTALLVLGSVAVVAAIALWVARTVNAGSVDGGLERGGFATTGLGVVLVLVGLYLSSTIIDAGDQVSQGDRGVTATGVTGAGFLIVAIGLTLGLLAVRAGRRPEQRGHPGHHRPTGPAGYAPR